MVALLRRLKGRYDPEHVFDGNFGVAPSAGEDGVPR